MFAFPLLLHVLWLIPVLTFLQWRAFRKEHFATDVLVASHLRGLLVTHTSASRVWATFALYMLAFACFVLAAAQPRYGEERRDIPESGKNAIIAIDTSRSMMADDVLPNRLTRAKLAAEDILATLTGYRVGLIAFAGKAYVQAPLTTDHAAVIESIEALDCFTVPRGGTKLTEVMEAAFDAFKDSGSRNHGLILFSDGGDEDPDIQKMLKRARDQQVRIVAIGCGTDVGSLIPNPDPERTTEFVLDPATNTPVHSKLEDATLRQLANETGGLYLSLGPQAINTTLVKQVLDLLETVESGKRERVKPIERFQWPLALGIVSLMFAMLLRPTVNRRDAAEQRALRRQRAVIEPSQPVLATASTVVSAILFCVFFSGSAEASWTGPKQMTSDDALRAYSDKEYARSRDLYARLYGESKNPEFAYGLGSSAMKLHEFDRANTAFSNALEAPDKDLRYRAHRGMATNLWDQGKGLLQGRPEVTLKAWTDALRHFDSALQIRPGDAEIQANRDYVAKFIEQVKKAIEQKKQSEQQQGDKGDKDDKKEEGDKGDKGDKSDQGDKGQKGDDSKEGDEDGKDGKDGKPSDNKDGKKGKDGKDSKDGDEGDDSKDGNNSDKNKDGKDPKGGDKKGDKEGSDKDKESDDKDGKDKDAPEGKDKKEGPPKGDIETKEQQADDKAKPGEGEPVEIAEPTNEETGFNPNEARNQLRTYTDEQRVKVQRRREFGAKRDW